MDDKPTGILDVMTPGTGVKTYRWNGSAEDQRVAKKEFETLLATGNYLAHVTEAPGKARQVRSWSEVEQTEKEQGAVAVQLTPAIKGG